MKAYYSDHFVLPLPPEHRFPMDKYRRLRERVQAASAELGIELCEPPAASDADLLRAHDPDYVAAVLSGRLDPRLMRRIGFPWSPQMVERSRRSSGATMQALASALEDGVAVNLAGGTHHARRAAGGGYCVFNDAAIAARWAQATLGLGAVLVIDLDVHQGDGTAEICAGDPTIFTLSLHGERNYPLDKQASDLDVALPDGCSDEDYLQALDQALAEVAARFRADAVLYLAGADPYVGDRLGRLALSLDGLAERDRRVFDWAQQRGLPVAVSMAGGYAQRIDDIVDIHFQTVAEAARRQPTWRKTAVANG